MLGAMIPRTCCVCVCNQSCQYGGTNRYLDEELFGEGVGFHFNYCEWSKLAQNGLGFTHLVVWPLHLVLLSLCIPDLENYQGFYGSEFRLRSNYSSYFLGLLAAYCTEDPVVRCLKVSLCRPGRSITPPENKVANQAQLKREPSKKKH
ncbi:hypothetical protein C5167_007015 [Papaver somniferum]|uniref:Uncharacterized protein n=1 Tax=Papaver somniferum TaxID=3469 RepID=A0A4Y7JI47_PAPSO|nr:hypothetical protein C5167_007015 [Papaver somniferum]